MSIGVSENSFWSVVGTFQHSLPSLVDAGAVGVFLLTNRPTYVDTVLGTLSLWRLVRLMYVEDRHSWTPVTLAWDSGL